jgi:hypothetical protein
MRSVSKVFLVFLAFVSFFEPAYLMLIAAWLFLQLYFQRRVTTYMPSQVRSNAPHVGRKIVFLRPVSLRLRRLVRRARRRKRE